MTPEKMKATQLLKEHQKLIYKIAWSYHTTTGVSFEELLSDSYIGFMHACQTYAPEKGKFTTYTWVCINNHLKTILKRKKQKTDELFILETTPYQSIDINNPEELCIIRDSIFKELGEHAKTVAYTLFTLPDEQKPENRTRLKNELHNNGISWPKIWEGMRELREFTIKM